MGRVWLLWGCILGFVSVALGAFAAHGLKPLMVPERFEILSTANEYLFYHAIALLGLGLWSHWEKWSSTFWAGAGFLLGSLLFSGSLYCYVLLEWRAAAMVTPVGGVLFLLGWFFFAVAILRTRSSII